LLVVHHLLVKLLLLLHCIEELLLFFVFLNLLSSFPEAGQNLFLFINAKPNSFSLCEGNLHWTQVALLRYENSLLMEICYGLLCAVDRAHPHKSASYSALSL